jgi:amino acid transporter
VVPRGMLQSVFWSGLFGYFLVCALVLAMPSVSDGAAQGFNVFYWLFSNSAMPNALRVVLSVGIVLANYLCALAGLTSLSRMTYAFARDGGLPFSPALCRVSSTYRTPARAIWLVAVLAVAFTVYSQVYEAISIVCAIFLYVSYVLPAALGLRAHGRTWTTMGPWDLGRWYRPLAVLCVLGCGVLFVLGVQPPNERNLWTVLGAVAVLACLWTFRDARRFRGPPRTIGDNQKEAI